MKKGFIDALLTVLTVLVSIFLILSVILSVIDSYGEFEYKTTSGESGIAEYCTSDRGNLKCRTKEKEYISVESYKKIK